MWKVVFIKKHTYTCGIVYIVKVTGSLFIYIQFHCVHHSNWKCLKELFLTWYRNLNARKQHVDCSIKVPQLSSVRPTIVSFTLQNRELQIMRKLEHHNIVKLKYFFYSAGEKVWCFVILWWILYSLWYYFKIYNK